ncbi:MAG: hypothetical protein ACRDY3_06475 [Acidimicrobiales bacterium]
MARGAVAGLVVASSLAAIGATAPAAAIAGGSAVAPGGVPAPLTDEGPGAAVAMASTAGGYWIARSDGAVLNFGSAGNFGSMAGSLLERPVVGIVPTTDGQGYWLVATDGGIFSFGDASFYGSTGGIHLNEPIVGMAATSDGRGYWLVAADGGVFAFGDARFDGSMGAVPLNRPVVGMAGDAATGGYWLVAADGGIFAFDAPFLGSTGSQALNEPIVGMAPAPDGSGYRFVAADGGVFSFGLPFRGSMGGQVLAEPITGMAAGTSGYWLVAADGGIFSFDAPFFGSGAPAAPASTPALVYTGIGWSQGGLEGVTPAPGTCRYRTAADGYALPDPGCTPGAVDTAVTQADIGSTICRSGYTSSVRPPESLTEPAKYRSMAAYGSPGSVSEYELDHLVPLELGGSSDVRNLWAEPDAGSPSQFDSTDGFGINAKDGVEDRLRSAVCSGQSTLAAAQQAIATDWTTAESVLHLAP